MSEFEKNYEKFEHNCQETFSKLNVDKMTSEEKIMAINAVTMLDMVLHCVLKRISEDEKKETNFNVTKIYRPMGDGLSSDCTYFDDVPVTPEKEAVWATTRKNILKKWSKEEIEKGLNGYG